MTKMIFLILKELRKASESEWVGCKTWPVIGTAQNFKFSHLLTIPIHRMYEMPTYIFSVTFQEHKLCRKRTHSCSKLVVAGYWGIAKLEGAGKQQPPWGSSKRKERGWYDGQKCFHQSGKPPLNSERDKDVTSSEIWTLLPVKWPNLHCIICHLIGVFTKFGWVLNASFCIDKNIATDLAPIGNPPFPKTGDLFNYWKRPQPV